jgi:hypothetical protein
MMKMHIFSSLSTISFQHLIIRLCKIEHSDDRYTIFFSNDWDHDEKVCIIHSFEFVLILTIYQSSLFKFITWTFVFIKMVLPHTHKHEYNDNEKEYVAWLEWMTKWEIILPKNEIE